MEHMGPLLLLSLLWAPASRAQEPNAPVSEPELTLEQATVEVLEKNDQVRAARAAVEAAQARYDGAVNVLLPRLSLNMNHARSGSKLSGVITNTENTTLGVTGTMPLFAGGANRASVRKAGFELMGAKAQAALTESQAVSDLRNAYARTLFAQEAARLSEEVERRRAEFVDFVRQKYEAGRESKAALLEMRAQHAEARWEKERDTRALTLARRQLNKLMGRPLRVPVRVAAVVPPPIPGAEAEAFDQALAAHPSLLSDEYAVAAGRESLNIARAGFFPTLDLTSSANKVGSTKWGLQDKNWNWTLGLAWPFFSGGRTRGEARAARAEVSRLEAVRSGTQGTLQLEAENSLYAWKDAAGFLDVTDAALGAAEARAWLVQSQYSTGLSSYFEWRSVQDQLIAVQKQVLAARRDLITAFARFERALGRGSR